MPSLSLDTNLRSSVLITNFAARFASCPVALWCSRVLLITAIVASSWCLAGYGPTGRLLTAAMVAFAYAVSLFDRGRCATRASRVPVIELIAFMAIGFSALQLIPLGGFVGWVSPGVVETRVEFSDAGEASQGLVPSYLTLSRWETKTALSTWVIGLVGLKLGWQLFADAASRLALLLGVVLGGVSQVYWGVIQQLACPGEIIWGYPNPGGSIPFGTFLNRNHAADWIGMSIGCAIGLWLWCQALRSNRVYAKDAPWRTTLAWILKPPVLATALLLASLLVGFVLTLSRGGWLSALAAIAILACIWYNAECQWTRRPGGILEGGARRPSYLAPLIAVLVIGLVLVVGMKYCGQVDQISRRLQGLSPSVLASNVRIDHWLQTLPAVAHYLPFGSGLGTYGYAHLPFTEPMDRAWYSHAHNQYLEVLMELGIPGISLLCIALVSCLLPMRHLVTVHRDPSKCAVGYAALMAILMQAIHAIGEFGLAMPANLLLLAVLMGAGLAAVLEPESSVVPRRKNKRLGSTAAKLGAMPWPDTCQGITLGDHRGIGQVAVIGMLLACSLTHLTKCVQIDRALVATDFSSRTPAPDVTRAEQHLAYLSRLVDQCPDAHQPRLRRVRLRMHLASRKLYDRVKRESEEHGLQFDMHELWGRVSLENSLYVTRHEWSHSTDVRLGELRAELANQLLQESEYQLAWKELNEIVVDNPMRLHAHLMLAKVAVATGLPWEASFRRVEQLASGDPQQAFAIGLFAMTQNDHESMLRHWKRAITLDVQSLGAAGTAGTIVQFSRPLVSESDIFDRLLPPRWDLLYRLSLDPDHFPADDPFRVQLLERACQTVGHSQLKAMGQYRAQFQIAVALGDDASASEWMLKALQIEPRNLDLRYQMAKSLVKSKRLDEAKKHLRVGTTLAPSEERFQRLLSSLQHRDN